MSTNKSWEKLAILVLLLLEFWAFSGSFRKFFNHDSLFYIIYAPRSWSDFQKYLLTPDPSQQYRPLTLGFMSPFVPKFGLNPRPYHWIPLVFHLLNTWLFYILARRLIRGGVGAVAATAFWGLNTVAAWITYDVTCISDFLLAFLFLASLILTVEYALRHRKILLVCALALYILCLLTKEAAVTFPLAYWVVLAMVGIREAGEPVSAGNLWQAIKKPVPAVSIFTVLALAHAGMLVFWLGSGMLYQQGTNAAYDINPWGNLLGKMKYVYWALNLPDVLHSPRAARDWLIAFALAAAPLMIWLASITRRKFRISPEEWGGFIWFLGLNIPACMLSHRLAKWYLYEPLLGFALAFGFAVQPLRQWLPRFRTQIVEIAIVACIALPLFGSTFLQARSYLISSDAAFVSDSYQSFIEEFRKTYPTLPPRATFFILPSYSDLVTILSSPPVDRGQLIELYYPDTRVRMLFAHKGAVLTAEDLKKPDARIIYLLDGQLYDVSDHFKPGGKITLHVLPTFERKSPPLFDKMPIGGRRLHDTYVLLKFADRGDRLPDDYYRRSEYWILQYLNGHFSDVTSYYKGRHRSSSRRLISDIASVRAVVSTDEHYPSYDHFATPTGLPVFFPTPEKEVFTQIGGSTAVLPAIKIPPGALLLFDLSWMYDLGDGGWAELRLRTGKGEFELFRRYMLPNPKGHGAEWSPVSLALGAHANEEGEFILKCHNDKGKNTIADWLNWRDLMIDVPEAKKGTD